MDHFRNAIKKLAREYGRCTERRYCIETDQLYANLIPCEIIALYNHGFGVRSRKVDGAIQDKQQGVSNAYNTWVSDVKLILDTAAAFGLHYPPIHPY